MKLDNSSVSRETPCAKQSVLILNKNHDAGQKVFKIRKRILSDVEKLDTMHFVAEKFTSLFPEIKFLFSLCTKTISPNYQSVPKDADFHVVQVSLLLTHHLPLKEACGIIVKLNLNKSVKKIQSISSNALEVIVYYSRLNSLYYMKSLGITFYHFLPTRLSTTLLKKHRLISKSTSKRYW